MVNAFSLPGTVLDGEDTVVSGEDVNLGQGRTWELAEFQGWVNLALDLM